MVCACWPRCWPRTGTALHEVDGVIISSVVPSVTTWLLDMSRKRLSIEPVVVSGDLDVGIELDVDEPKQLGADRIVDCVAAFTPATVARPSSSIWARRRPSTSSAATARYQGGAIAAGVGTSLKALADERGSALQRRASHAGQVIGRNTADQLRAGIVAGHLAMLEGMIARTRAELGDRRTRHPHRRTGAAVRGSLPLFRSLRPQISPLMGFSSSMSASRTPPPRARKRLGLAR